jgi:hypothetical protein
MEMSMNRHMTRTGTALAGMIATVVLGTAAGGTVGPSVAGATAPAPTYQATATFTGPITSGHVIEPLSANPLELAANGYVQQEFFAAGVATAFTAKSEPSNGRWTIAPATKASYRTRILVRRPMNPARFNGNVVVEWMNVSAGESAPDWDYLNPELMRAGYAYVAVSVQHVGVDGGAPILGTPGGSANATASGGLVGSEPARYGTLHQPGDQYALDMFAQIGQALHNPKDAVLGTLHPKHVLALGESQSAFYLTTYADALQPLTHTFNGIFIHSRGGTGAPLSGTTITGQQQGPNNLRIRTDLSVPVFMFETQTDLIELGYAPAQQPNTSRIRTWQVAGTSHADAYEVGGDASIIGCTTTPVNDGPQHTVVQAAFAAFTKWVDDGTPPPSPAPFKLSSTNPATLALDSHGNVIGGVRTPAVDVPVSTLSGAAPAGASKLCALFGSAVPFSPGTLTSLYQTKSNYLVAYTVSLDKAIKGGYILPADRATLLAQAQQVQIPS